MSKYINVAHLYIFAQNDACVILHPVFGKLCD